MVDNNSKALVLITGALLLLFVTGATLRDLTFPDELRYTEVAREMLESGNWVLPTFNYQTYTEKPPLFFWMVAASMKGLGLSVLSSVLPTLLSALLTILITYHLGIKIFDRDVALYGAWILSSFLFFLLIAQVVRMDMTLTLLVTTALYFFFCILKEKKHLLRRQIMASLCIGAALITKGPVGIAVPLIIILTYLLITKEANRIEGLFLGPGLMIMAAIPLLWLLPAGLHGGENYLKEILLTQSIGRAVQPFSHREPLFYYFLTFPFLFVPWSFYLMLYFDPGIRKHLPGRRKDTLYLTCWVLCTLVFFSLIRGKIVIYLLPLMPALALVVARAFTPILQDAGALERPRLFKSISYTVAGTCWIGVIVFLAVDLRATFLKQWWNLFPPILVLVFGGAFLFYYTSRMKIGKCFVTTGLISILFAATITLWIMPRINHHLSLKPMAQRILTIQKDRPRVAGYKVNLPYLTYYTHAPYNKLRSIAEFDSFVQKGQGFLIVDEKNLSEVEETTKHPLFRVGRFQLKGKAYLLFLTHEPRKRIFELVAG